MISTINALRVTNHYSRYADFPSLTAVAEVQKIEKIIIREYGNPCFEPNAKPIRPKW